MANDTIAGYRVYTESKSMYRLNHRTMTWARFNPEKKMEISTGTLVEWPSIKVGDSMQLIIAKVAFNSKKAEMKRANEVIITTPVQGITYVNDASGL